MISMTWPQYQRGECSVSARLSPQEAEILMVLLVRHPQAVGTADLIEALWPDADIEPDYADSIVRRAIGRLRGKLGTDRIVSDWRGYSLGQVPCN